LVGDSQGVCILDWQRSRHRRAVSWRLRCRDLAVLDATLHEALASDPLRLRCLRAYVRATASSPPLARLALRIPVCSLRLREVNNIRETGQLAVPAGDQQFVQLMGGDLLVVRSYYEQHGAAGCGLPKPRRHAGAKRIEDIPELAHTLFRLARFGVPAPRL